MRNQSDVGRTLTREPGPGAVWVTSRHPEPRATALRPLPTSKAQAPLQTVYVAPRTLSSKWSSVIKGVGSGASFLGPVWHLEKSSEGSHSNARLASTSPPSGGCPALDSWSRLSPPTSEPKKDSHPDLYRKLSKAGFFSRPSFLNMAVHFILGKVKRFVCCQHCAPHILEPRSCKILAFSLGSLVVPYGELCSSLETTQRNSAWSSLP